MSKMYRTLIRIEELDINNNIVKLAIPGWHETKIFEFSIIDFSNDVISYIKRELKEINICRMFANVNLDEDDENKIYIENVKIIK